MKKRLLSIVLIFAILANVLIGFATVANAEPSTPVFDLSLNVLHSEGENIYYYLCQNEEPLLTVNASGYDESACVYLFLKNETPGGDIPFIKYAPVSEIDGSQVSLRDEAWVNNDERTYYHDIPDDNYKLIVCENDNYEVLAEVFFKVREHKPMLVAGVDATCTQSGLGAGTKCAFCETVTAQQPFIPALGHDWEVKSVGIAPTCQNPGTSDTKECKRCHITEGGDMLPPVAHDWGEWKLTKEPTCSAEGEETRYCKFNKNHKQTRSVPADAERHTFDYVVQSPASLNRSGSISYRCIYCGKRGSNDFSTDSIIPAIASVTLAKTSYTCDNTAKKPAVIVKDDFGSTLKSTCYSVTYQNNVEAGTAKAIITFSGNYSGTIERSFTMMPAKPAPKVSKVTATAITLSWNKVPGAKYYRVYSYNTKTGKCTAIANTAATSYTVSKLSAGSAYSYLVRAYSADKTAFSPYTKADVIGTATLCKAPTVKARVSGKTVTLKWAKVTGAKSYKVFKYNTKTKKYSLLKSTSKLTISLTKQPKGTNYYLVRAMNQNALGSAYTTKNLTKAVVKK